MPPKERLTLREKLEIIEKKANGSRATDLSNTYQISRGSIYKILKKEDQIKKMAMTRNPNKSKKLSKAKYEQLEDLLKLWFKEETAAGANVTPKTLRIKASSTANDLGLADFKASNGWLQKFKKRLEITYTSLTGELKDGAEDRVLLEFLSKLEAYISEKQLGPCSSSKQEESKYSCVCVIIGHSRRPLRFSNSPVASFVYYKRDKPQESFESWFHEKLLPSLRTYSDDNGIEPKALLIMDDSSSHPTELVDDGFNKIMFLAPQPINVGNIPHIGDDRQNLTSSEVLELVVRAWSQVSESTTLDSLEQMFEGRDYVLNNLPSILDHFQESATKPLNEAPELLDVNIKCEYEVNGKTASFSI